MAAVAACSAAGTDGADSQTANATGGTTQDEASFLHVFAPNEETPVCAGALIADKAIVVPRSCVRDDLEVGLSSRGDNPFSWNKTKVTKVHIPERGPADIAVLEIEKPLASSANLVTRAPLRAGYTIFARQSVKDGIFGNPVGYTTQMPGALLTATETQATILPQTGAKLCMRDLGAMVCSSTESTGLLGLGPRDRCGLAGIVVAPPESGTLDLDECSGEGWKIAPLGLYAEFLKQFAPKLFNPIVDAHIFGTSTFVPDGLWGYDSAGDVKSCELSTPKLDAAKKNVKQLVRGKASFEGMGGHAEAIAHFGIAKKNAPNVITWIPAQRGSLVKATAFDDTFTADIGAAVDGDYIVTLRISANGGETWKRCDDVTKPLALTVGDSPAPTNPPPVSPPSSTDAGAPPPASTADAGSAAPPPKAGDDDDDTSAPVPAPTDPPPAAPTHPKKPKSSESGENGAAPGGEDRIVPAATTTTTDSGCSTAPGSASSNLPVIGLLFGLVALARRRRVNES
jgi:MYXO-CTERM domain-containing protein